MINVTVTCRSCGTEHELDRAAYTRGEWRICPACEALTVSPRAANQLRSLDPADGATILDTVRDRSLPAGASLVAVNTLNADYRCFVGRHKDGSRVLLAVTARPRGPCGIEDDSHTVTGEMTNPNGQPGQRPRKSATC